MFEEFAIPLVSRNRILLVRIMRVVLIGIIGICFLLLFGGKGGHRPWLKDWDADLIYWIITAIVFMVSFVGALFFAFMKTEWFKVGVIHFFKDSIEMRSGRGNYQFRHSEIDLITFKDDVETSENNERDVVDHFGLVLIKRIDANKEFKYRYIIHSQDGLDRQRQYIKYLRSKEIKVIVLYK